MENTIVNLKNLEEFFYYLRKLIEEEQEFETNIDGNYYIGAYSFDPIQKKVRKANQWEVDLKKVENVYLEPFAQNIKWTLQEKDRKEQKWDIEKMIERLEYEKCRMTKSV